jgi:DNA-binding transcriptional regulator YbjK
MHTRQALPLEPSLVEATATAVTRWGLAQVTVERIAAEAGLSGRPCTDAA